MNDSEVLHEPLRAAHNVRFRINCEFLHTCAFNCAGCFVNRKASNFTPLDLDILLDTANLFRNNGMTFDEIILGPTDFFAADNTLKLLEEPVFREVFKNGDVVLTILTTLQSDVQTILDHIVAVNDAMPHPDQEIEVLVVFDLKRMFEEDDAYISELQDKLRLLDRFVPAVDYAFQMNIQDPSKVVGDFTLPKLTSFVREKFDTIVEFNPSFLRTGKEKIVDGILDAWNTLLQEQINEENKDDITFTMSNAYHAGFNEITYNFHDGDLYMCPFIYENVFDRGDEFKVAKSSGQFYEWNDILDHDAYAKIAQFNYANETDECGSCPYQMSCISKHVLYYMQQHGMKKCVISKPTVSLYT